MSSAPKAYGDTAPVLNEHLLARHHSCISVESVTLERLLHLKCTELRFVLKNQLVTCCLPFLQGDDCEGAGRFTRFFGLVNDRISPSMLNLHGGAHVAGGHELFVITISLSIYIFWLLLIMLIVISQAREA